MTLPFGPTSSEPINLPPVPFFLGNQMASVTLQARIKGNKAAVSLPL
jgi:hypothetical protein